MPGYREALIMFHAFLRGNFFSRTLSKVKCWIQKNTVHEVFSDSFYRLLKCDSLCIQSLIYGPQKRKVNGRAREIHSSVNAVLNAEMFGTFATEVYRCRA